MLPKKQFDGVRTCASSSLLTNVKDYVVGTATLPENLAAAMTSRDV